MGMINPLSAASISIQWRPSISVFPSASGPVWPAWLGRGPWSSRCRNQGVPGGWSLDLDMTWPIQVQNINGHDSGTDWLEVPTIYKAYFLGLCKGISQQNMAWKMVQHLGLGSWNSHWTDRGFPSHGGTPINRWVVYFHGKIRLKYMMQWGIAPWFGKPPYAILEIPSDSGKLT